MLVKIKTILKIYLKYGFKGVFKAIKNKKNSRPLLENIDYSLTKMYYAKEKSNKPNILLISNELTQSGAPLALLEIAKILLKKYKNKFDFYLLSFSDGPLKKQFLNLRINLICMPNAANNPKLFFETFYLDFSYAIANTILSLEFIKYMQQTSIKNIYWWVHEGPFYCESLFRNKKQNIILNKNVYVYAVSNIVKKCLFKYFNISNIKLIPPCFNLTKKINKNVSDSVKITLIGGVDKRKGYDVFLSAYNKLDCEIQKKCSICIIGRKCNDSKSYRFIKNNKKFNYFNFLDHQDTLQIIQSSDLVIIPSREETFSIVALESLIYQTPIIVSDNIGILDYLPKNLTKKISFESENYNMLSKLICNFIRNKHVYDDIIVALSKLCIEKFSPTNLEQKITQIIKNTI